MGSDLHMERKRLDSRLHSIVSYYRWNDKSKEDSRIRGYPLFHHVCAPHEKGVSVIVNIALECRLGSLGKIVHFGFYMHVNMHDIMLVFQTFLDPVTDLMAFDQTEPAVHFNDDIHEHMASMNARLDVLDQFHSLARAIPSCEGL